MVVKTMDPRKLMVKMVNGIYLDMIYYCALIFILHVIYILYSSYYTDYKLCMRSIDSKKSAKKVVKWGKGLVVFITTEAKEIGWDDRTIVKVSVEDEDGKKFIKLEKGMRL